MGITRTIRLTPWALSSLLVAISVLIGVDFGAVDGWAGEHVLTLCIMGSAWLMFAIAELIRNRWTGMARDVSAVLGAVAVLLSLRGFRDGGDFSDWWSIGPMFAITALAVALNLRTKVRDYIFAAGLLFGVSTLLWWLLIGQKTFVVSESLLVNVVANSLAGLLWLWLDLRSRQRESSTSYYFSFHNFAAVFLLGVLALLVILSFAFDTPHFSLLRMPQLTWLAFASVVALMTACLWDRYSKLAVAGLYALGLIGCAIGLQQLTLSADW